MALQNTLPKGQKDQVQTVAKISSNLLSNKEQVFRIYKQLSKLNSKKQNKETKTNKTPTKNARENEQRHGKTFLRRGHMDNK